MKTSKCYFNFKIMSVITCIVFISFISSCSSEENDKLPPEEENNNPDDPNNKNSSVFVMDTKDLLPVSVPVIDKDDNVYMLFVDNMMLDANSTIVCINNKNEKEWEIDIDETVTSLSMNNKIIFATAYEKIYAINTTNGTIEWDYRLTMPNTVTNTKLNHKPCFDGAGNIIIAMDSYLEQVLKMDAIPARVISLSTTGTLNWEKVLSTGDLYNDRYSKLSEPIIIADKIFLTWYYSNGSDSFDAMAINNSGEITNSKALGDFYTGQIMCANKTGQIYIYGAIDMEGCEIKLLNSDLSPVWNISLDDRISPNNVVLDAESNIYFNCEDGNMYKYNSNGAKVWEHNHGKIFVRGNLILGNDNYIYKMGQGLDKINTENGQQETIKFDGGFGTGELSMRNNGELVVPTLSNKIYFVNTNSKGLKKDAHWPKQGKDYSNSSSIN